MRVTLDTNVLLSALLFRGKPSKILKLVMERRVLLFLSPFILHEFEDNLAKKFGFSAREAREARMLIEVLAQIVRPQKKIGLISRKDSDNRILECAVEAKVKCLITGDKRDILPLGSVEGIEILSPSRFVEKYFPSL